MTKARNRTPALKLVPGQRMTPETVSRPQGAAPSLESRRDLDWSICMARAQDGDKEAYRRLLVDIVPYLRKLALRYLRDRADIEDAVQDVLVTVHAVRQTYDPARPFGPWLTAIANRRIVDQVRRRGR